MDTAVTEAPRSSLRADESFLLWLREAREAGERLSVERVKTRVKSIMAAHAGDHMERNCKWFLLWNKRY